MIIGRLSKAILKMIKKQVNAKFYSLMVKYSKDFVTIILFKEMEDLLLKINNILMEFGKIMS